MTEDKIENIPEAPKYTWAVLILIGILAISAFIPAKWLGAKPLVSRNKPLDLSAISAASEVAEDSNGDGTISWKEVISQTFTDSTSVTDSVKNAPTDDNVIARLNDPNNLTGSFSKNLYLSSTYMNENNITDTESRKAALNQLISQEADKIVITNYTAKDLKVSKTEDRTSLKNYGNNIAPIVMEVFNKKTMTDDISNLNLFLQNKDTAGLSALTKKRGQVDVLIQKLLNISVPPSAVIYHILTLNRIAMYRDTLENLSKSDTDPIRARIALDKYTQVMSLVFLIPTQLHGYFDSQNIAFSSKDSGYLFTVGYNIIN